MKKCKVIFSFIALLVMMSVAVFPAQAADHPEEPYYIAIHDGDGTGKGSEYTIERIKPYPHDLDEDKKGFLKVSLKAARTSSQGMT